MTWRILVPRKKTEVSPAITRPSQRFLNKQKHVLERDASQLGIDQIFFWGIGKETVGRGRNFSKGQVKESKLLEKGP